MAQRCWSASHLPLAFTYLRTFPIWWHICADHVPNIGRKSPSTWFLRSLLRFFLLCFSSLTSEGGDWHYGWWLTYDEIVRPATIQAQQLWYLSTCSTAASPQFLSTRASARASSKSSASNSAGPACQQLLHTPNTSRAGSSKFKTLIRCSKILKVYENSKCDQKHDTKVIQSS